MKIYIIFFKYFIISGVFFPKATNSLSTRRSDDDFDHDLWFNIMQSLPDELMENFTKKLEDMAQEKTFREAKNFACCVSGNKVFKCKEAGDKNNASHDQ